MVADNKHLIKRKPDHCRVGSYTAGIWGSNEGNLGTEHIGFL